MTDAAEYNRDDLFEGFPINHQHLCFWRNFSTLGKKVPERGVT